MDPANTGAGPEVHIGTWINWSRGPIMGTTLTVTKQNGNLLIAFTAFFIGFLSSRAWRIISFALHRLYSTPTAQATLHHQRQAILRNSETAGWSFWTLGQLAWAWRRSVSWHRPLVMVLPALLSSLLCLVAFAVASGFSSQISTGIGDEVLIDGEHCGLVYLTFTNETVTESDGLIMEDYSRRLSDAVNYAQQCYNSPFQSGGDEARSSAGVFDCNAFHVPSLPRSIDTNAPCPFADGICRSNSSNLLLDTGYLDTHEHLGLNAPKDQRMLVRQRYHCAPLITDGFTSTKTENGTDYVQYHYGEALLRRGGELEAVNYTLMVPSVDSQYATSTTPERLRTSGSYLLSMFRATSWNGTFQDFESDFKPIPSLDRPDGTLGLVFLVGNGVIFFEEGADDWYRATVRGSGSLHREHANGSTPQYLPEEAASPLACVQQFQFCRGDATSVDENRDCGPLGGWWDAFMGAGHLFGVTDPYEIFNNPNSTNTPGNRFIWLIGTINYFAEQPNEIPLYASSRKLLSELRMVDGIQFGLYSDQWKRDITHWWSTWLSLVQISFADMARGPRNPSILPEANIISPANEGEKDLCRNQKMQSRRHSSFSMFGICFVYISGALIVIISYTLEPLFGRLGRRKNKTLEWVTTDALHLQALGFQGRGLGTWSRLTHSVPITGPDELLEPLMLNTCDGPTPATEKIPRVTVEPFLSVASSSTAEPPRPDVPTEEESGQPDIADHGINQSSPVAEDEPTTRTSTPELGNDGASPATEMALPSPTDSPTLPIQPSAEPEADVPATTIVHMTPAIASPPNPPGTG